MSVCIEINLLKGGADTVVVDSTSYAMGWVDALAFHDMIAEEEHQRLTDELEMSIQDGIDKANDKAEEHYAGPEF